MQIFSVCFIDRGKARSHQPIEAWIHGREAQHSNSLTQFKATIQDLDQEADRLADRLEEHIKEKRKRDFEILLLKGELEEGKKYPRGMPPGPSPEEVPGPCCAGVNSNSAFLQAVG